MDTPTTKNGHANHLRAIRRVADLTQLELAYRSGLAPNTIGRLEARGADNDPRLSTAYRIARALGMTVQDIWPPEEPPPKATEPSPTGRDS